ncbi:LytR family transcriptional attenuator [Scopulibacillus darangshiensis]|uniref:LytR family transcriptional attenuator n=1 Tax=Scopulibacillus darangshiensis TaxID=442528 RepID=A0A4R2NX52_9BACL|nr:LCP family protein [Scopulibacillus darangshiensis]TCP25995.1 LytR family transcriptional attenuator [Scopulibacillus darangshiensis]
MVKKIMITLGVIIALLVVGGGAYAYYLYHSVKSTAGEIYEPVKKNTEAPLSNKGDKPISILLMGVDERPNDRGRADTLIVMTLNPKTKTMQMVSIPRDTRTKIIGHGTVDKINHSYAFGGTKMAMDTVENFVDVPIDYYVKINMQGLSDLVDAVGGITVYNDTVAWTDEGFYKKGYRYEKGELNLNGPKALGYVRMRHFDSDFGRNKRQRDVIQGVINKAASFSSISRYDDILSAIEGNVKTNMTFDDMKYIAKNYRSARQHIKSYEVKGTGKMIRNNSGQNIYYLIVNDEEKQKVHNMIAEQLK